MTDDGSDRHRRAATAIYAQPGVSQRLIALQDDHAVDVLIVLHALWLKHFQRRQPGDAWLRAAEDVVWPWRTQVIEPIRAARRAAKAFAAAGPVYEQLKAVELAAEYATLDRLYALSQAPDPAMSEPDTNDLATRLAARYGTDPAAFIALDRAAAGAYAESRA